MFRDLLKFFTSGVFRYGHFSFLPFPTEKDGEGLQGGRPSAAGMGCAFLLMLIILMMVLWLLYDQPWARELRELNSGFVDSLFTSPDTVPDSTSTPQ